MNTLSRRRFLALTGTGLVAVAAGGIVGGKAPGDGFSRVDLEPWSPGPTATCGRRGCRRSGGRLRLDYCDQAEQRKAARQD